MSKCYASKYLPNIYLLHYSNNRVHVYPMPLELFQSLIWDFRNMSQDVKLN